VEKKGGAADFYNYNTIYYYGKGEVLRRLAMVEKGRVRRLAILRKGKC